MRVFNPNSKLKDAFTDTTAPDSSAEIPTASDLEKLLGIEIFEKFLDNDVRIGHCIFLACY